MKTTTILILMVLGVYTVSHSQEASHLFAFTIIEQTDATILEQTDFLNGASVIAKLPIYFDFDRIKEVTGELVRGYTEISYHTPWRWDSEKGIYMGSFLVLDLLVIITYHDYHNSMLLFYQLENKENGNNNK